MAKRKSPSTRSPASRAKRVPEGVSKRVAETPVKPARKRTRAEEKLERREQRYRALLETIPSGVEECNTSGVITFASPVLERILGYGEGELIGKRIWDLAASEPEQRRLRDYLSILIREQPPPTLYLAKDRAKDGRVIDVEVAWNYVRDESGGLTGFRFIIMDITERKRAEESLWLLSKVFTDAADPIIIRDLTGTIIDLNPEAERSYGWRREELLGQPIRTIVPPERHGEVNELIARCKRGESIRNVEFERWNKAGERIPILLTLSLITNDAGKAVAIATIAKEITELKQTEEALRKSEAALRQSEKRLRALAAGVITAQEEERRRLARELHDDLNQRLVMLAHEAATLQEEIPQPAELLRKHLEGFRKRAAELSDDVHAMAYELHPSAVEHLGLAPALKSYFAEFRRLERVRVEFIPRNVPESVPADIALCLYRVVQQALHNVAKHSGAKKAQVELFGKNRGIQLTITDSGAGFDPAAVRGKGLGLVGIEERVRLVGGNVSIHSAPGSGTRVELRAPLPEKNG